MRGKTRVKAGLHAQKKDLRIQMRSRLASLPLAERQSQSQEICKQLSLILPTGARVALFAGLAREVHLLSLLETEKEDKGRSWYLPRVVAESGTKSRMDFQPVDAATKLKKSALGIMEPQAGPAAQQLDVIVCPGLAFTAQGERLGQGGGFYDRALAKFPSARFIGVCFSCQLLEVLPSEAHDIKMAQVLTPLQGP